MASDYSLSSAITDCSSQPRRSEHELGRMHHQLSPRPHPQFQPQPHPHPHPHPLASTQNYDLHEVVLREIEKESIRQEVIRSELIRRRALEAQVNNAMRAERAMAIQRGRNELPRPMGLDVPARFPLAETRAESRFLEERIMFPPPPRNASNNWQEGGGSNF